MSASSASSTGRELLAASAAAKALSLVPKAVRAATASDSIRPFHFSAPQEALDDLRRRFAATRWLEQETVADQSQGVQLATVQKLSR